MALKGVVTHRLRSTGLELGYKQALVGTAMLPGIGPGGAGQQQQHSGELFVVSSSGSGAE